MKLTAVPGVRVLRTYERAWLPKDVVAGLVLTALLVPQGMAYAELAGLPPITGLYTSILCLTAYALVGPSRILVLGPDSSLGPMIAATILPLVGANGDPAKAVMLASMLALLVGAIMLLAGLAKLGFIADLLSKPTQIGYMNGLAFTILVGQLPKLFGFSVDADGFIPELQGFVRRARRRRDRRGSAGRRGGRTRAHPRPAERVMPKVPSVLVAVVLSILAVNVFDLTAHGVSVVGPLPSGFPPFTIPHVSLSDVSLLLARRVRHRVRRARRHDLDGVLVRGPSGRSGARGPGDDRDRSRERRGGLVPRLPGEHERIPHRRGRAGRREDARSRAWSGRERSRLMLVAVPGLLKDLPQPALAAVVISASLSLADVNGITRLWKQRKTEAWLADHRVPRGHVPRRPPRGS